MKNRRRAFEVVDMFEDELCDYTGAPYAVAVDSCTNALFLSMLWFRLEHGYITVALPKRTYVGVAQAALNAGLVIEWKDWAWIGWYSLHPLPLIDSAKSFYRGMWHRGFESYRPSVCVSFQAGKILPIGRGGAILTDDPEMAAWLRRARFDGRTEGDSCDSMTEFQTPGFHAYMTPPDAARGLWLLTYLEDNPPDQVDTYPDLSTMFPGRVTV